MTAPKNLVSQLKGLDIDAVKTDETKVPPELLIIIDDETHPNYDPSIHLPLVPAFTALLGRDGVKHPVMVRRDGVDKRGVPRLIVTDGRQRVRHACEWNRLHPDQPLKVAIKVQVGSDLEAVLGSCSVNAYRINTSLLSEAWKARQALRMGASEDQVCQALNKSKAELTDLLTLLDLEPSAQQAIESKAMPRTSVRELSKLPRAKQGEAVEKVAGVAKGRTAKVHEVKAIVDGVSKGVDVVVPTRLKCLGRGEIEALVSKVDAWRGDGGPRTDEQIEAAQAVSDVLRHVLGYDGALTLEWLREVVNG